MNKLELKNIYVSSGKKEIVKDVSLTVNAGEVHVLMGPNGSGKSSLLSGVFGHPAYTLSGGVFLNDEDITLLPTHKKAGKGLFLSLQYIPEIEGVTLVQFLREAHKGLTGKETPVLEFYKRAEEKAKALGIDPNFLKKSLNAGLSGGEKKQTEALQMALLEPAFAFLDEIDSGVDIDSLQKLIAVILERKAAGTGTLLISHYPSLLKQITPDYVHVMREGKLVKSGGIELVNIIEEKGFDGIQ